MLKDLIEKSFKKNLKKEKKDKILFPIMDGFVDIKGYDKDGNMFYHDCGDNVVTDWMRHAIMMMLAGVSFSNNGNMPTFEGHTSENNPDGYIFNGKQFLNNTPDTITKYCSSTKEKKYALFPTKILLGTGKEYSDWNTLKTENQAENQAWYTKMLKEYGKGISEELAINNFDTNISSAENDLSGTLENGIQSGDGLLKKCRTVNDPDTSTTNISTAPQMYKNYNVVGAIKTTYKSVQDNDTKLNDSISESGRLLIPEFKGVGNPCFIYMDQSVQSESKEKWDSGNIKLGYDKGNRYITKISFETTLTSQDADNTNKYYPYNGWTLKQIGLYNDGKIELEPEAADDPLGGSANYYPFKNMPRGMLLAVKNITPITKTADASYTITWTLTI